MGTGARLWEVFFDAYCRVHVCVDVQKDNITSKRTYLNGHIHCT